MGLPQLGQNLTPSGTWDPQFEQNMRPPPVGILTGTALIRLPQLEQA